MDNLLMRRRMLTVQFLCFCLRLKGDGDWVDLYNRVIRFEPEEWNIPYWDNKLYGGQQFERLLAEYRAVSEHTEISEVTMDDVATAAGINKLNNIPNYSWAVS